MIQGPPQQSFSTLARGEGRLERRPRYVADRSNNRLQVFRLDGTFVREAFLSIGTRFRQRGRSTTSRCHGIRRNDISVADDLNKAIHILDR